MANLFLFANNASTTLAAPITAAATSLTVQSGDGALFPNPGSGQQFAITLVDAATGNVNEIVYCTARTGDVMTIERGQESTSARAWLAGDVVAALVTAGVMDSLVQEVTVSPIRTVTTSGAFTLTTADANGHVGLARTAGLAPSTSTLPSDASAAEDYTIQDLIGNFQQYPCTINAPGGMTIAGLPLVKMNWNRASCTFTYFGGNLWGVDGLVG